MVFKFKAEDFPELPEPKTSLKDQKCESKKSSWAQSGIFAIRVRQEQLITRRGDEGSVQTPTLSSSLSSGNDKRHMATARIPIWGPIGSKATRIEQIGFIPEEEWDDTLNGSTPCNPNEEQTHAQPKAIEFDPWKDTVDCCQSPEEIQADIDKIIAEGRKESEAQRKKEEKKQVVDGRIEHDPGQYEYGQMIYEKKQKNRQLRVFKEAVVKQMSATSDEALAGIPEEYRPKTFICKTTLIKGIWKTPPNKQDSLIPFPPIPPFPKKSSVQQARDLMDYSLKLDNLVISPLVRKIPENLVKERRLEKEEKAGDFAERNGLYACKCRYCTWKALYSGKDPQDIGIVYKCQSRLMQKQPILFCSTNNQLIFCNPMSPKPDDMFLIQPQTFLLFDPARGFKRGDFDRIHKLGSGGQGEVYCAFYFNWPLALKRLPKAKLNNSVRYQSSALTELAIQFMLSDHPCILPYLGGFQTTNYVYHVNQYLSGNSLRHRVFLRKGLGKAVIPSLWGEIIEAISFLHSQGIIHRDVKMDNVLVDNVGHVKLGDLGFAVKLPFVNGSFLPITETAGTPGKTAPEAVNGEPHSFPVDWYSFGILFYEAITAERAIDKETNKPNMIEGWEEANEVYLAMIHEDPKKRLDEKGIKSHPFFSNIDWKRAANHSLCPPFYEEFRKDYNILTPSEDLDNEDDCEDPNFHMFCSTKIGFEDIAKYVS